MNRVCYHSLYDTLTLDQKMKNKTFSLYLATILFRIVQHYIDGVFISSLSGKLAHFPRALGHILCSSSGEEPAAAATSDPEVERTGPKVGKEFPKNYSKKWSR